jgi:hypothetical protein
MSDAMIFILAFGGLFILRLIAATVVFYYILPRGDRCPMCDAATLRIERGIWTRVARSLRPSWCLQCGWEGMLRRGPLTPQPVPSELTKQL